MYRRQMRKSDHVAAQDESDPPTNGVDEIWAREARFWTCIGPRHARCAIFGITARERPISLITVSNVLFSQKLGKDISAKYVASVRSVN